MKIPKAIQMGEKAKSEKRKKATGQQIQTEREGGCMRGTYIPNGKVLRYSPSQIHREEKSKKWQYSTQWETGHQIASINQAVSTQTFFTRSHAASSGNTVIIRHKIKKKNQCSGHHQQYLFLFAGHITSDATNHSDIFTEDAIT